MDRITKEKRSELMSKIKGKGTKPESILFNELQSLNIRFKKHYKLLGNPDIAIPSLKLLIFIDGDFWHGRDFKKRKDKLPEYWVQKISRNIKRDRKYNRCLRRDGWKVLRIWEYCILKDLDRAIRRVQRAIYLQRQNKVNITV